MRAYHILAVHWCGSGGEGAASSTRVLVRETGTSPNLPYFLRARQLVKVG